MLWRSRIHIWPCPPPQYLTVNTQISVFPVRWFREPGIFQKHLWPICGLTIVPFLFGPTRVASYVPWVLFLTELVQDIAPVYMGCC